MGQVNGLEKTHHRKHNQPVNNVETTNSTSTTLRRTKREKIATKANIFGTLDDDDDGHHNDDELPQWSCIVTQAKRWQKKKLHTATIRLTTR